MITLVLAARVRPEMIPSVVASAEMLRAAGGPYAPFAALLTQAVAGWAPRRKTEARSAVAELCRLADTEPQSSEAAVCRGVAQDLARYETSAWKRGERSLSEPPQIAQGGEGGLRWHVLAGYGRAPKAGAIGEAWREAGGRQFAEFGAHSSWHDPIRQINGKKTMKTAEMMTVVEAIAASPQGKAMIAGKIAARVEVRRAHLVEIARLDAQATKDWSRQEKLKADAAAKIEAARKVLAAAYAENNRTVAAVARERLAFDTARRDHEVALLVDDAPEFGLLEKFRDECLAENEAAARALFWSETPIVNQRTGKRIVRGTSNRASVTARREAIMASWRASRDVLPLIDDPCRIEAELQRLRASWPPLEEATVEVDRTPIFVRDGDA